MAENYETRKGKKIRGKTQKRRSFLKEASLKKLLNKLPLSVKEEVLELWLDYEQGKTKEARFVRQVNRIQTLLQALDYGEKQKIKVYKSWWVGSKEKIDDPLLIQVMKELEKRFKAK